MKLNKNRNQYSEFFRWFIYIIQSVGEDGMVVTGKMRYKKAANRKNILLMLNFFIRCEESIFCFCAVITVCIIVTSRSSTFFKSTFYSYFHYFTHTPPHPYPWLWRTIYHASLNKVMCLIVSAKPCQRHGKRSAHDNLSHVWTFQW